ILAYAEQGKAQLDVLDLGSAQTIALSKKGALAKIDYGKFKLSDPNDVPATVRKDDMIGSIYFSTVLGYRTETFPHGSEPKSWSEFWDLQKFPQPRMWEDLKAGAGVLEFALIADGVPAKADKLYPIDVDRALKSLSHIRPKIVKFWDTGALSAELIERKEALMGSIWNGRIQVPIDKGAPMGIQWNQNMRLTQYWSIPKAAPHPENGRKLIDFALQPKVQAALTKYIAYGPTNKKAQQYVEPKAADTLPTKAEHFDAGFDENAEWWANNLKMVTEKWQAWQLQG
ncbi:MAG: extracellular solute-binding protein, partial [Chloroflexota bacterium]|nr:extracellular solute-binding protein [Chloroflexota bacterium]